MSPRGDWRDLLSVQTAPFNARWLDVVQKNSENAIEAIRSGLPNIRAYPWQQDATNIAALFGLEAETHCFNEQPHEWLNPLEPQITKGFVHFLNSGSPERQRSRCLSFVKAALACSPRSLPISGQWQPLSVCAVAEEKRIDILVELTDGKSRFGVVIEAKFDHHLTQGQMEIAEKHVLDQNERAWDSSRSAFLVIAPDINQIETRLLRKAPNWRPVSWWAFLIRLEREIEGTHDCADYRRLRRSVWSKAY